MSEMTPPRLTEVVMAKNVESVPRSIGDILLRDGLIRTVDIPRIVRAQSAEGLRFGEAAVRLGLISQAGLMQALSHQYDYPYLAKGDDSVSGEVIAAFDPFSPAVEQLRILRSQLLMRWFSHETRHKTLAVVSAGAKEGRSFISANLAVLFAQLGERTLLIDADLRQPSLHRLFRLGNQAGLANLLASRCELDAAIDTVSALPHLTIMPAGITPPNPLELLSRPRMGELLEMLKQHFDVILLDTPAAMGLSDASVVARRAGGALIVAERGKTCAKALAALAAELEQAQVERVGCVINR
ncbi:polysaccharide biosynthesis tyrosine autokinase [Craterilacuibacter sp.]|uniref:polysaccharide biosynthesis tyrosine autokinase n=1 Tax=Craterilacuibacter sp. TaxID=2870909 RepID=UPI003F3AF562